MKPCKYRGKIYDSSADCSNHDDLLHGGTVPIHVCQSCPYATAPAVGFFAQTAQLLAEKGRRGEIRVAAKPCGGCDTVLRRDTNVTQFVFPYWHSGANDDEIRWAVRSIEQNYQGAVKITIIGDKPPWYQGHYIAQQRVHKHTPNRPFRDMLSKVWTMATHPEIDPVFVWVMDDCYLIKPVTFEQLAVPRAVRWQESSANSWQRRKQNTMRALTQSGRTIHDYATHLPHVVEKDKLRQLYDEFALHQNTMLWEVLYGNTFREPPQSPFPFFRRIQKRMTLETLKAATADATIFNHTERAWCPAVRELLQELFPSPASCELDQPYQPKYRVTTRVRPPVIRRPLHTHRAYIEAMATVGEPGGVSPQVSALSPIPHIMIIQAAYTDERLSLSRLDIARHTSVASLAYQSVKPVIHIALHPDDPHLSARLDLYLSTGCEVKPLFRSDWKLYKENWELPEGRKLVSRMDDDDVICRDYCKELQASAPASGEWNLLFPVGYVFWNSTCYRLEHMGNQFVSLVTDQQTDPHQEGHWLYHKTWQTKIVSNAPSWIWVRHGDASTSTLAKYRTNKLKGIDAKRTPINLRAIERAIAPAGHASGSYKEHKNRDILRTVLHANHENAGTAIPKGFE